jgi:DNA-binding CsgD family transcriptional regulator/tetratricopeptide (TPR) repeat protein
VSVTPLTPAPVSAEWPFVARGEQVDALATALVAGAADVVHLVGPSGVGKTRLATALLHWAERDGFAVARVRASRGTAAVPLAALTSLLPTSVLASPAALLVGNAAEHVRELGDGSRVVVLVDDVDLLDAASLAVVGHLVEAGLVHLVTTARDDAPTPDLLLTATRQGRVLRVEVGPLDRFSVATLLHLALEGPVSARLEHALWELSGGSPLYLRELVHAGRESGAVRPVDGVWTLTSALVTPGSLRDLVAERFGDLDPAARTVLELLALCSVVAVEDLEDAAAPGVVEELEAAGLVEADVVGHTLQCRLSHPLYGQVLRDTVPSLRARRLLLGQVERVEGRAEPQHGDALRIARWRLEATGTADPALLVEAARLARAGHDYAEIERLCRAALTAGPDAEVSAMLGEALYELGRFTESDEAFADAVRAAAPGDVARFALSRALNQFLGLGRLDEALEGLALAAVDAGELDAAELRATRALLLTQGGRTGAARSLLETLPPGTFPEVAERARSLVLLREGRLAEAAVMGLRAWEGSPDTGQLLHPSGFLMVVALARLAAGDLPGAAAAAAEGADAASRQGVEFQSLWLRWVSAVVELAKGDVAAAATRATEVLASATAAGFPGPARLAAATAATAQAQQGEARGTVDLVARLHELAGPAELYAVWVEVALGWADVVAGDPAAAAERWRSAARRHEQHGDVLAAADLLHEAVRLGDHEAAEQLTVVAERIEGPLAVLRGRHARATVSGDASALVEVSEGFAGLGLHLLAAEAASVAMASGELGGRERARVAALAAAERRQCPRAATPALVTTPSTGGLTARELQVARLAASGRTSREIAELLVLSVRTVDNHLQNAYGKLGVGGREQLRDVLLPGDVESSEGDAS